MERLASVLGWCLLCWHVAAKAPAKMSDVCLQSCQSSIVRLRFKDSDESPTAAQLCLSRLAIKSMFLCLTVYCDRHEREAEWTALNDICIDAGGTGIPPWSIISNYTAGDIERLRHIQLHEKFPPEQVLDDVVVPSAELHRAWTDTLDAYRYVSRHHFLYGIAMIVFWVAVVALGAANRLMLAFSRFLHRHRLYKGTYRSETSMWLKRKIMIPATFGYRSAAEVWCGTIPLRIQTLTLVAFASINILFSIYGYRITPVNLYFPGKTKQILRYVSDRTGIISFANFPIIWLFGMRNNFAIWLTGWDFVTYNKFHRWIARIATLQAVVHSVGFTVLSFQEGGWSYFAWWWTRKFWVVGEVATVVMCALVACSVYWLRRRNYELFLILHIVMSIVILVTMSGHVSVFNGEYDSLIWVPVFVWVFDRAFRILRIFSLNPTLKPTVAAALYSSSANMVRLGIPCRFGAYKAKPGTYYYLSIIDDKRLWESHPFTVASVVDGNASSTKTLGEQVPLLETDGTSAEGQQETETAKTTTSSQLLTFLIRPYDGFTGRLRDLAASEWPRPASVRVLVDGPYGHSQPLHMFDRVVFVVGGSGVVVPMSYLETLTGNNIQAKSIQLHWAVREPGFAAEVIANDMGDAVADETFHIDLYFSAETVSSIDIDLPAQVSCHYQRPSARQIVMAAAECAGQGSLAVVACGPARLADDARRSVIEAMDRGLCEIEYFEESFRW
ncbi:hypothetical protein C2857_007641 [Epichloe festucae Fl1]|uniref:FAD-binding FR-type domain-containing protein n=1 Tax=Epichloe festucae (strain Fl1) TaxID=877507 RepID=A0A7S9KMQ1_EPIFF|nr:hypothetical protein C2857_007641 [Epichloe festucae Fl1]